MIKTTMTHIDIMYYLLMLSRTTTTLTPNHP